MQKIYISHVLTGLVFWYGIEKLFMQSIGINAFGIGLVSVVTLVIMLVFDIPSGILADKWSRKGTLILSAISLAICSFILGASNSLGIYMFGAVFYGLYLVFTSGTYQAVIYDSLKEDKKSEDFSRVFGRAHALFLVSAGVANILSGFLVSAFNFRFTFYITIVSCVINVVALLSLHEPKTHKPENKERILVELPRVTKEMVRNNAVLILTIVTSALTVVEIFKQDFGQPYFLRYMSSPEALGILWALYAFTWAMGSFIAHRFVSKLDLLILATVLPLIAMSFIDNYFGILLFMIQAVAAAALVNQIQTRIQDATPSGVRASILSTLSFIGTIISIPASLIIGGVIKNHNVFIALRSVTVLAVITLVFWFISSIKQSQLDKTKF